MKSVSDTSVGDGVAISVRSLRKVYQLYDRPVDRLKQLVFGRSGVRHYREFAALQDVSFELKRGDVLGLVGRNGAGKSTLLQAICGTVTPTSGVVAVNGRVAALLELGAGFNPEFTGRENIFLNAAVLGVPHAQVEARYDQIVEFSGIADFIEQPVKTYSSGMYMRLAFAIATSVDPDILVIDEALSVGDGAFARKSFDRIMELKDKGATILFCSHSAYQVEALCDRVLWIERGRVRMDGVPSRVVEAYSRALDADASAVPVEASAAGVTLIPGVVPSLDSSTATPETSGSAEALPSAGSTGGHARIRSIVAMANGVEVPDADGLRLDAGTSELRIKVAFASDPNLPTPTLAYEIQTEDGQTVSSATSLADTPLERDANGDGVATVIFPALPLMRGRYRMNFYLACERMLFFYEHALVCVRFEVRQDGLERGVVFIPHHWDVVPGPAEVSQ